MSNLEVGILKEEIPSLVEKLVQNNVKLYGIKEEEQTLEDAFFEMTGGNVIE